jgi:hypothetical protein
MVVLAPNAVINALVVVTVAACVVPMEATP